MEWNIKNSSFQHETQFSSAVCIYLRKHLTSSLCNWATPPTHLFSMRHNLILFAHTPPFRLSAALFSHCPFAFGFLRGGGVKLETQVAQINSVVTNEIKRKLDEKKKQQQICWLHIWKHWRVEGGGVKTKFTYLSRISVFSLSEVKPSWPANLGIKLAFSNCYVASFYIGE